jgi:hypothetical protein
MFLRVIRALGWAVFWLVLFVLICPAVVIVVQVLDQLPAAIAGRRDSATARCLDTPQDEVDSR